MTEEYKKNLMALISGNATDAILGSDNAENQLLSTEYDYSGILPSSATDVTWYGILDVPESLGNKSVLYGEYKLSSSWYGLVILIDENQTPIEVLTEFDSGTKLRPIQHMMMDDSGNIYAVDSTLPGVINQSEYSASDYNSATLRFLMLNNFALETNGEYEIKLRRAYNITGQVSITALTFFCRDMFKASDSSDFVLIGTRVASQQDPVAIHLTINVGSSNTWVLYPSPTPQYSIYLYQASNVEWNGGTPSILIFVEDNTDVAYFTIVRYLSNDSNTFTTSTLYTYQIDTSSLGYFEGDARVFQSYKLYSNSFGYFTNSTRRYNETDDVAYIHNSIFMYQNGTITSLFSSVSDAIIDGSRMASTETIYAVGTIDNPIFLRSVLSDSYEISIYKSDAITGSWDDISSQSGTYSNGTTWEGKIIFPETPMLTYNIPQEETPTPAYINRRFVLTMMNSKSVFNLNYYYFFPAYLPETTDGKYNVVKNMFVENGYSGSYPTYDLAYTFTNSFVPSQVISSHEEVGEMVTDFARNIFNVQIDGNITTSSVEIPYNYLNNDANKIALYSKTNLPMTPPYSMTKNRYEIVDVNFVNTLSIINNNDNAGIYNDSGASQLNGSITRGADYVYYIDKYLVNYKDGTYKLGKLSVESVDDTHANVVFLLYVDKLIDSIDIVDNATIIVEGNLQSGLTYQTIDGTNLEVGKFYNITQPVRVE